MKDPKHRFWFWMGINLLALYLPLPVSGRYPDDPVEFLFFPIAYPTILGALIGGPLLAVTVPIAFWTAFFVCNRRLSRIEYEPRYLIVPVTLAFYSFFHADMTHELAQNLGHS